MKMIPLSPDIRAGRGVPVQCCQKARRKVAAFRQGNRNYKRIEEKGCGYLKIDVTPFWRLLSRNNGRSWDLITHERYNAEIRK